MNATSSRSHAALILSIEFSVNDDAAATVDRKASSLVLVDLAGSERFAAAGGNYARLEEAKAINLSLSALGNCMSALADGKQHVPYRDSKLTRLLQGSLGGGSRTAVIVNIAPGNDENGDVLNSLKFASRASKVKVVAKVSRYVDYEALYFGAQKELDRRDQIERELSMLQAQRVAELENRDRDIEELRELLRAKDAEQFKYSVKPSLVCCSACSKVIDDESSTSRATAAESGSAAIINYQNELDKLSAKHNQDITSIRQQSDTKVSEYFFK
jgi:hypothetical protein